MAAPVVTMQQLLEAGAHFGHQTHRWNPQDEAVHLRRAQRRPHHRSVADRAAVRARARFRPADASPRGGKVLFVGTKRQAQDADRRGRRAVRASISSTIAGWAACSPTGRRSPTRSSASRASRSSSSGDTAGLTKKEVLQLTRERDKLELSPRRHPRHGRPSRRHVRDRRQQGRAGDQGSQCARHPGRRDPRFERQPAGHRLPGPGQ